MFFSKSINLLLPLVLLCAAANADVIFNFDNDSLGTSTAFEDTVNGLSATFSSSADPGGFVIYPTMFENLTGNVLGDPGPAFVDNLALGVTFSHDLSAITLDFATADFVTASPFTLTAYENSTLVGSSTVTGQFPAGFSFPEGQISFGGVFNNIVLSSTATDFAVDNLDVIPTANTPEPRAAGLLLVGLFLPCTVLLRRRRAACAQTKTQTIAVALLSLSASLAAQTPKSIFPLQPPVVSTVPSNGDVNPYGVAFVPKMVPADSVLQPGDILVSNFNNSENLQGTGATISRINSAGVTSTFYTSQAHGLTAALGVLSNGIVLVGNLPTADGTPATVQPGSLAVLNRAGQFLGNFGSLNVVDGPWGMAVYDTGNGVSGTAHVWMSNVLSGVVARFDVVYTAATVGATAIVLANGFTHRTDPAALVLGPSGLAYSASNDTLYVASSSDNAIYSIPTASAPHAAPVAATLFIQDFNHLHGPLNLAILPNGHLLVANSDGSNLDANQPSELVEYTAAGQFVGQMPVDPNNSGAFGFAVNNMGWGTIRLAAVDDNANSLKIWTTVVQ